MVGGTLDDPGSLRSSTNSRLLTTLRRQYRRFTLGLWLNLIAEKGSSPVSSHHVRTFPTLDQQMEIVNPLIAIRKIFSV